MDKRDELLELHEIATRRFSSRKSDFLGTLVSSNGRGDFPVLGKSLLHDVDMVSIEDLFNTGLADTEDIIQMKDPLKNPRKIFKKPYRKNSTCTETLPTRLYDGFNGVRYSKSDSQISIGGQVKIIELEHSFKPKVVLIRKNGERKEILL